MNEFIDTARADVLTGRGLVVRFPRLVAVVSVESGSTAVRCGLVDTLQRAATMTGSPDNPTALELTKFILAQDDVPHFGAITATPAGLAVYLYGDTHFRELGGDDGQCSVRLDGRSATFAVDCLLPTPDLPFGLGIGDCLTVDRNFLPTVASRIGLLQGVVPGAGIVMNVAEATDDAPAENGVRGPAPESLPKSHTAAAETEAQAPQAETIDSSAVSVRGIACSRGHLNSPDVAFCQSCGIRTSHRSADLVEGVRPPLGLLVFDDGSNHILDRDCLFGRKPHADLEMPFKARAVQLDDESGTLSRRHAAIKMEGWSIFLVDQNSTNGTFVAVSENAAWMRLEAGQPFALTPGTRVRLGRREFVFESHLARL